MATKSNSMTAADSGLYVEFAGRLVPARLVTRPPGEVPQRCLEWSGGWVGFGAAVVVVYGYGRKGGAESQADELRKLGYRDVLIRRVTTKGARA